MNRKKYALVLTLISFIVGATFAISRPMQQESAQLVLYNQFSPSETTYTNITMYFTDGDPYNGHSVWTYTIDGLQSSDPSGFYAMDCDSGEYTFFGIDEFVNSSIIRAEVEFSPTEFSASTYHYLPLGYFYQKTALESNTHWALALYWDASGLRLYYNTGNGDTPSYTTLNTSTPKEVDYYTCFLYNFGDSTYVQVIDITPLGDGTIYDGYVSTPSFDATSLYAGFGEYATGGINCWSRFDDFILYDVHFTSPTDGTGISLIDAYVDETYVHSFYDVETGYNSTLLLDSEVTNVTLVLQCWLNGTTFDIATVPDGANRIRHNVTVTNTNHMVVFSQSNFTYSWGIEYESALFLYQYWVELDFPIVMSEIYTATITYDVYYEVEESYYLNEGTSLSGIDLYSHAGLDAGEYSITSDGDFIESWIMPNDAGDETMIYIFNFTEIDNTNTNSVNVSIRYKIESGISFYYFVAYNDTTYDTSTLGLSTSWVTLNVTCDPKFLDYIQLYNSDYPNNVASGNLSVWIDYIEIYRAYDKWNEVSEMNIYFHVPTDYWAIEMLLILAGLGILVLSSTYAAYKITNDPERQDIMIIILVFMLGLGLFLGGIGWSG